MARPGFAPVSIISVEPGAGLLGRLAAARFAAGHLERVAGAGRRRRGWQLMGLVVSLVLCAVGGKRRG